MDPGPSRPLALTAFLLMATSLWLPWWVVRVFQDGERVGQVGFRLFTRSSPDTTAWAPMLTGVLVAVAMVWAFVMVAGHSWKYSPRRWRRDLGIVAVVQGVAVLTTLWWPGRGLPFAQCCVELDTRFGPIEEGTLAGLGWWLGLLALVAMSAAAFLARQDPEEG